MLDSTMKGGGGEGHMNFLCISYNCMWVYNDLKREFQKTAFKVNISKLAIEFY